MRGWLLAAGLAMVPLLGWRLSGPADRLARFPRVVLWAWDAQQDLRFVRPGSAGIAFLARTVWLDGTLVRSRPRLAPLRYTPGTDLMAVVRLESPGRGLPLAGDAVDQVLPAAALEGVRALQVDFDARQSEREWYRAFLSDLRKALPRGMPLAMTALESWCEEDGWIGRLPVAEATPMLFRMGRGEQRRPYGFAPVVCRGSVGVSTDELPARVPPAGRIYFFQPGAWTAEAYDAAMAQAGRWQR